MGILNRLFGNDSGAKEKRNRKLERKYSKYDKEKKNAGTLSMILSNSNIDSVFGGFQTNGYVQNNEVYIEKKLKKIYMDFNSRELAERAKELFLAISEVSSISELNPELVPWVAPDFYFGSLERLNIVKITAYYLSLYQKKGDVEYIHACICFLEKINPEETELTRYFVKFKRPSLYKTLEGRNIKFAVCPNCGNMVYLQNNDIEQCISCDESVSFKGYGWQVYETERITEDTLIETMVTV